MNEQRKSKRGEQGEIAIQLGSLAELRPSSATSPERPWCQQESPISSTPDRSFERPPRAVAGRPYSVGSYTSGAHLPTVMRMDKSLQQSANKVSLSQLLQRRPLADVPAVLRLFVNDPPHIRLLALGVCAATAQLPSVAWITVTGVWLWIR